MVLGSLINKLVGMAAPAAWTAVVTSSSSASVLAVVEPVTATVVGGTVLANHLIKQNRDVCAAALKKVAKRVEREVRKELGEGDEFSAKFDAIFDELSDILPKVRPSVDDLVSKWNFDPEQIAVGLVARCAEHSELFKSHHLARQVAEKVIGQTIVAVRDDPDLYAKLEPAIARDMLGSLAGIEVRFDRIADSLDEMPEKLVAALEARDELKAVQQAGLERKLVILLARQISADVDDFDQAILALERAVEVAIDVQTEGTRGSNLGDFVDGVLARVAELSAAGQFDDAAAEAGNAFEQWQQNEADRQHEAKANGIKFLDAGLKQDLLRRDAVSAAQRIVQKVELEQADSSLRFETLRAAHNDWYARGWDKGLNLDLEVAIEIARLVLDWAEGSDEQGMACNNLGTALSSLGERESGTVRLEAAVVAYHAALEEWTRNRVPLLWATVQNNLGNALLNLGERESGTVRLEAAVVAYHAALEEWTRNQVSLRWATVQNNLGNALSSLGERESGTVRFEAAVVAYHAALEELTWNGEPLLWAGAQNNLGNALLCLGERSSGKVWLEAAVAAFHTALRVYTQECVPLQWATAQQNLGNALMKLGERESGTVRLEAAVAAYQAALEEQTRDKVPLGWAGTTGNLGVAKMVIAERKSDCAMAQGAEQQMQLAFEVLREGGHESWAANFELQLPRATALVAKLCG